MKLVLHVDRVVLEGVPLTAPQGDELRAAITAELATLLAGRPLTSELAGGIALRTLAAPPVTLSSDVAPGPLAAQVARSVAVGLAGPPPEAVR